MEWRDRLRTSSPGCCSRKLMKGRFSPGFSDRGNQSTQMSPSESLRRFGHRPSRRKCTSAGTLEQPSIPSSSRLGLRRISMPQKFWNIGSSSVPMLNERMRPCKINRTLNEQIGVMFVESVLQSQIKPLQCTEVKQLTRNEHQGSRCRQHTHMAVDRRKHHAERGSNVPQLWTPA